MNQNTTVIKFEDFETVSQLHTAVNEALHTSETALVLIDNQLCMIVPAKVARRSIVEKIAKRLAEHPTILNDIQYRIENEDPEDWE